MRVNDQTIITIIEFCGGFAAFLAENKPAFDAYMREAYASQDPDRNGKAFDDLPEEEQIAVHDTFVTSIAHLRNLIQASSHLLVPENGSAFPMNLPPMQVTMVHREPE